MGSSLNLCVFWGPFYLVRYVLLMAEYRDPKAAFAFLHLLLCVSAGCAAHAAPWFIVMRELKKTLRGMS